MKLLHLKNTPIFSQLQLEEALLRTESDNYCIINEGSSKAIVMGISGKPSKLISKKAFDDKVLVIKRYSGGGTVIVDEKTLFVSFIFNKSSHDFEAFPERILKWSETFYHPVFDGKVTLRENDYVIGEKKCGGNAQYIRKDRFVHHTTFLWDYSSANMDYLLHPEKTPKYRLGRDHTDFICKLKDHFLSKKQVIDSIKQELYKKWGATDLLLQDLPEEKEHRKSTKLILNYE